MYCPPIRVEPICFIMFFRKIKIHHLWTSTTRQWSTAPTTVYAPALTISLAPAFESIGCGTKSLHHTGESCQAASNDFVKSDLLTLTTSPRYITLNLFKAGTCNTLMVRYIDRTLIVLTTPVLASLDQYCKKNLNGNPKINALPSDCVRMHQKKCTALSEGWIDKTTSFL